MVFSTLFALGVTLLSLWSRNSHAGPEMLMGDPDALTTGDIPMVFFVACCTFLIGLFFLRGFQVAIFDSNFALLSGFRPSLLHHLLLALVALASVSAFRAVGFVMTLAFFVIPPLMARLWTHSLRSLLLCSVGVSVVTVIVAVALGRHLLTVYYLPVSTGALAAVLLAVLYGAAMCLRIAQEHVATRWLTSVPQSPYPPLP
jgi:manganese/zinc/iron transport system permease protein